MTDSSEPRTGLTAEIGAQATAAEDAAGFPAAYVERVRDARQPLAAVELEPDDLRSAITMLEQYTTIDAEVPTGSRRQVTAYAKRGVKRLTAFTLHYMANQVTLLGEAMARFGEAVGARVERVERELHDARAELDAVRERLERLEAERRRST
jgi:hypothetical protein